MLFQAEGKPTGKVFGLQTHPAPLRRATEASWALRVAGPTPRKARNNRTPNIARCLPPPEKLNSQRALRDRLMSRGKNYLPTVSRQFLTRNYPRPNRLLNCLPNCLSPTREGFLSSFKINPAVRAIARQVRDENCLAAIFAPRHQSVSSGPLGC